MKAGAAMPLVAARATTLRQLDWRFLDLVVEIGVEQEVYEVGVACVGVGDFLEEAGADDAAAAEDGGDFGEVEFPVVFFLGFAHELEALGVGADFGAVEGVADGGDQFVAVAVVAAAVGPLRILAALTRSSLRADMHRAKTASAMELAGMPMSRALVLVHLPVPFWPAVSRTLSTNQVSFCDRVVLLQDVGGDLD